MKRFTCDCGQPVFFENAQCLACGARLGFDPGQLQMLSLQPEEEGGWEAADGSRWLLCANAVEHGVCNWLLPADQENPLCRGCQFNRTVPNQALADNQERWRVLESAKKRLLYTLFRLRLPLEDGHTNPRDGLLLDFKEDERSHDEIAETFVGTGYLGGVITINAMEADHVARTETREELNENYRTVLGHLRHESGHFYGAWLEPEGQLREDFTALFGDESQDYGAALQRHYAEGPAPDWREHFISAYAAAHPSEDWAETWGHYLHIHDALETAAANGVIPRGPEVMPIEDCIEAWRELSLVLNELNRSIGHGDAYPFAINAEVERKLLFVDRVILQLQEEAAH